MTDSGKKYGLMRTEIAAMQSIFRSFPKLREVVLYGSRAKGNHRPGSDIDLTLKGDRIDYPDLVKIENALDELSLPYTIDLSIYREIKNPDLIDHIYRTGIVFYPEK